MILQAQEILSPVEVLEYAYIISRRQYDAGRILKRFESMHFENCTKVIAVLNVDLSVPIFTYVFGEARQNGRYALVSLFRLAKNNDGTGTSTDLLLRRTVKVALHELGHLFNIFHCDDTNCLMHFSGDLEDLDNIPLGFCNYCSTCF